VKIARTLAAFIALIAAWSLCATAIAQDELLYQKRANRYEGIKPKPVSGFDIELLAAQIDYREPTSAWGDRLRARFFLDQPRPVYLVVRELDYKYFYWLDKVEPKEPWRAGFGNVFEWPTNEVLKQLRGIQPYDLGAVARLDKPTPSADENVAPVLLYQSQPPQAAGAYVFYFRLREDAALKASIYAEGDAEQPIYAQDLGRLPAERPLAVRWTTTAMTHAGKYRLVLKGHLLSTNDPIVQVVRFYHQPKLSAS